ncbi:VanZ family protein [Streptomyces sp. NPDC051020]|uniref:VanZ family protein n=1 Tax=Streptomyces sp. NPDC051020 TaxID=3155409 RepID=UPI003424A9AA
MISAIFRDNPWIITSFLVLSILLGTAMWYVSRRKSLPRAASILFGLSLAAELAATLSPSHTGAGVSGVCAVNRDLVGPLIAPQGLMNVGLFVPVAFFSVLLFKRPAVSLAGGGLLSAWTEFIQAVTPHTGRSCASEDLVANTLGALIGVTLAVLIWRFKAASTQTNWRTRASRADLIRASQSLAIGGGILFAIGAIFVTPVLVEVADLTKASPAQKEEAERVVRKIYGENQVISAIQYTKGAGGQEGQFLVTLNNGFMNFTENETFITGSTASPSLPGVSQSRVRTDEDAIRQATDFVRNRFPWALKKSKVNVNPTVAGTGQRTVAWRQRVEGVLMPMRMDVVVEPTGRISAFTGRNEPGPATPPGHKISVAKAREIAAGYLGGSGDFRSSELLVQKNSAGQWESRWAVNFVMPPAKNTGPEDVPTGSDVTTVMIHADTGQVIDVNS